MSTARWIHQTQFYDPTKSKNVVTGNCMAAALASLLNVPLSDIPDWIGLTASEFWDAVEQFVNDRGFQFCMRSAQSSFDGYYLASGPSARGTGHTVVYRAGELVHDPHPSNTGLLAVDYIHVLIPFDPSFHRL